MLRMALMANDCKPRRFEFAVLILLAVSLPLSITLSETFYYLAFLVWITGTIVRKRSFNRTGLEAPIAVLAAAWILAVVFSSSPVESARILKKLIIFGLFFFLANSLDSDSERGQLISIWLLGAILASLWVVVQHFQGILRPGGPFGYIVFAHFAAMLLGVCLPLMGLRNRRRTAALAIAAFVVGVPALLLTLTRAGWMSFLVGLAVFFLVKHKWFSLATSAGALALIALTVAVYAPNSEAAMEVKSILRPFDNTVPRVAGSNLHRWYMWKASLQMFKDHPLLGIGPGQFYHELPNYLSEQVKAEVFEGRSHDHPGSMFFDYLATMGIVGFGALLFFLAAVFRLLILRYKSCDSTFCKSLVLCVLLAFTCFCTGGLFDQTFHSSNILLNLCFLLGLVTRTTLLRSATQLPVESVCPAKTTNS